jgi:hypothetical protein
MSSADSIVQIQYSLQGNLVMLGGFKNQHEPCRGRSSSVRLIDRARDRGNAGRSREVKELWSHGNANQFIVTISTGRKPTHWSKTHTQQHFEPVDQ